MYTSRREHDALPFSVVEGTIPSDLFGHLFLVAPASTFRPPPADQRATVMVGDGLVCRFDLAPGGITMRSRLARTHDFVADEITSHDPDFDLLRFHTAGIVRIGALGTRDFANTAFVPMPQQSGPTRMALTYDAGRPVEIDPVSLEVLGPIGGRDEWRAEALKDALFPIFLSPAHPVWDRRTGQLFTVCYGRGAANFMATVPLVYALTSLPSGAADLLGRVASIAGVEAAYRMLLRMIERSTTAIDRAMERLFDRHLSFIPDTFTDLVRWDGSGRLERFRLVLPGDREVSITQSIHQIAVTRDHVVVMHTGFKIGFASAFNDPAPKNAVLDRLLHAALTRPQLPFTTFYVVPRAALDDPNLPVGDDGARRVTCRRVQIPLETDHFVADYDDIGGRITLHVAHSPATDLAEWIRPHDHSAYQRPISPDLHGFLAVGAMDVGRFGRYVVDARDGAVQEAKNSVDERLSWAISLYAGRGLNTENELPARIESLYWCTIGFFPELLTQFVYDLYSDSPHRMMPLSYIRRLGGIGRPSAILRLDARTAEIADSYELPPGKIAGSMQHVPRPNGGGYLVGTVYTDSRTELWILDADYLAAGPLCRLAAQELELGFSLHTAWLPSIAPATPSYRITAREELATRVDDRRLQRAFERDLYPRFE